MQLNGVECRTETAENKLYDIAALLYSAEERQMSTDEWIKISRVVRHALADAREYLCGECKFGDLAPTGTRINALQRHIEQLEKWSQKKKQKEAAV